MREMQGDCILMKGLCSKCFSSGVSGITDEKNPQATCEKCREYDDFYVHDKYNFEMSILQVKDLKFHPK